MKPTGRLPGLQSERKPMNTENPGLTPTPGEPVLNTLPPDCTAPPSPPSCAADEFVPACLRHAALWLLKCGRHLLVANPFYLASAVMMLYGLFLVSTDPQLDKLEASQLAFNFSSLQLYEVLLVFTAIVLARRAIWYDSTLLIVLENLFLFVPFMLISQATLLLGNLAAWAVGLSAVALALGRFWGQRHYLPELNFPTRLLVVGVILLAVNISFPLAFRHLVENDSDAWTNLSFYGWLVLLPALVLLANWLPRPAQRNELLPQRRWLPFVLFILWLAGTCVHFHSVNYVDNQKFHPHLVAPVLWALSWTIYFRLNDFVRVPGEWLKQALLCSPVVVALIGVAPHGTPVFLTLAVLNALLLGLIYHLTGQRIAWQLLLISLFSALAAVPESWGVVLMADFSRNKWMLLCLGGYALLLATLSKDPRLAVLGAVVAGLGTAVEFGPFDYLEQFALQNALLYLLLHSLHWNDQAYVGSRALRLATATGWLAHSVIWLRIAARDIGWTVFLAGLLVLGIVLLWRLLRGEWGPVLIWLAAAGVTLSLPVNFLYELLRITPAGHLTVLGSFIVFALGTVAALTKSRWVGFFEPTPQPTGPVG
jgi:hypothetical protein